MRQQNPAFPSSMLTTGIGDAKACMDGPKAKVRYTKDKQPAGHVMGSVLTNAVSLHAADLYAELLSYNPHYFHEDHGVLILRWLAIGMQQMAAGDRFCLVKAVRLVLAIPARLTNSGCQSA